GRIFSNSGIALTISSSKTYKAFIEPLLIPSLIPSIFKPSLPGVTQTNSAPREFGVISFLLKISSSKEGFSYLKKSILEEPITDFANKLKRKLSSQVAKAEPIKAISFFLNVLNSSAAFDTASFQEV